MPEEMEDRMQSVPLNDNEHVHLYGQTCSKARWVLGRIRRKTALRIFIFVAVVILAFSAGIVAHLLFMQHTVCLGCNCG